MSSLYLRAKELFRKADPAKTQMRSDAKLRPFRKRYGHFKALLASNAALGVLLGDMEDKLSGNSVFGMAYINNTVDRAVLHAQSMADSLAGLSGGKYSELRKSADSIEQVLRDMLGGLSEQNKREGFTVDLADVDSSNVDWVGGKCANLGELIQLGLNVPRGFAITTTAYGQIMRENSVYDSVFALMRKINLEDKSSLLEKAAAIQEIIRNAPITGDLEEEILAAYDDIFGGERVLVAVRSSAQSEDSDKSFAGQYLSVLGVDRAGLVQAYREVLASLFTPRAIMYRLHQGVPLEDSAMAVACIEMIDAEVSGVAFSHDPVNLLDNTIIINASWGLGRSIVDGLVTPDAWIFLRDSKRNFQMRRAGSKEVRSFLGADGELLEEAVPGELRRQFCLDDEQAAELAALAMQVEGHYGSYQDIEWAIDKAGKIHVLQARPINIRNETGLVMTTPLIEEAELLAEGGDVVYPGVASGPVVLQRDLDGLENFPKGGILVTGHSAPGFVLAMDRTAAIIAETGGVTGHMASLSREFRVPTILNLPNACKLLQPGQEVTVDAFGKRVYAGRVERLLALQHTKKTRLEDSPVYDLLKRISKFILPLNLVDPKAANFKPSGCKTLHDVMRFAHELCYKEMFSLSDNMSTHGNVAVKLKVNLPIDLHIIDLDHGTSLSPDSTADSVTPDQITSVPFAALLKGLLLPSVVFRKPRPINMRGFMSVMGQQMANGSDGGGERFGDRSYAIISDKYLNFSSRVGYHYSVLDAYCGKTISKNYISFVFSGGAADEERRIRRVRCIGLILERLDFNVEIKADRVSARFQKYDETVTADRLDQLGRLLQVTRQMDMLMVDENSIRLFADDFMNGVYR